MRHYYTSDPAEEYRLARECLSGTEAQIVVVNEAPCVWTGQFPTLDLGACARLGLTVAVGEYLGGSIVCMPGDLSVMQITFGRSDWAQTLAWDAFDWLTAQGLQTAKDGNDVLADGKKVVSWATATTYDGWCQSVVHFSIGPMDLSLVREICTKPMTKVPGSLGEYGITAEMLMQALEIQQEE